MASYGSTVGNVLYLVVCAAPPARDTPALVKRLQSDGWDVCVITTPAARSWVEADQLAEVTGHPVRSEFRGPGDAPFEPLGDAVLVAPASFNTLNKLAAGINDNLALGLVNEALGRRYPVVLAPWVNDALAVHPAYAASLDRLNGFGARVARAHGLDEFVDTAHQAIGGPAAASD
jgi:phosphopantothenoylcysteine decarboxylase